MGDLINDDDVANKMYVDSNAGGLKQDGVASDSSNIIPLIELLKRLCVINFISFIVDIRSLRFNSRVVFISSPFS